MSRIEAHRGPGRPRLSLADLAQISQAGASAFAEPPQPGARQNGGSGAIVLLRLRHTRSPAGETVFGEVGC